MSNKNSRIYSKDWEKDPFNDIDLRGNLCFELPKAGENEEKNLKAQYVWHEDEVKIKKSFLTVKCQNCTKSTRCKLDRDIIIMSNNFTNNDYHIFYCDHCSYVGKKYTRFRINRDLTKVKFDVFNISQKITLHRKYRPYWKNRIIDVQYVVLILII